jgi:hypothetical protein
VGKIKTWRKVRKEGMGKIKTRRKVRFRKRIRTLLVVRIRKC